MRILITGGYGYIGSELLESLSSHPELSGSEVVVVDNWSYGRGAAPLSERFKERIERFHSHCLDVSDARSTKLRELISGSHYIVNLASLTQIPETPLHARYILEGVRNISEAIVESDAPLRKVVDISSASVYGAVRTYSPPPPEPYSEEIALDPEKSFHNYAASKLRAERIWQSEKCRGIPFTVLRLSTVFGYAIGMRYNQFVNQFLVDAVAGRETRLPGSPDNARPYIHVKDAAGVILHLLTDDLHTNGHILNLGASELNPRHGELFETLSALLGRSFGIKPRYAFAGEIGAETLEESYRLDFSKFESMVKFPPRYDFETGARDLVQRLADA